MGNDNNSFCLMAGYFSGRSFSGTSHRHGSERAPMRDNVIYHLRSILFFILFLSFFHSRLAPNIELGAQWPPAGIMTFNPWGVPFLNTVILLSSGVRVTWSHKSIVGNYHGQTLDGLLLTIVLGTYFTILQGIEYVEATFTIADSVFGSAFWLTRPNLILTFCRCSLIILVQMTIQLEVTMGKLCERSQYHSYAHTEDGVIFNAPATKPCGILKHY